MSSLKYPSGKKTQEIYLDDRKFLSNYLQNKNIDQNEECFASDYKSLVSEKAIKVFLAEKDITLSINKFIRHCLMKKN